MKKILFGLTALTLLVSCKQINFENNSSLTDPKGEVIEDGVSSGQHRIFTVSVSTEKGNLGGINGADTICDSSAKGVGLNKTYKALLGEIGSSAHGRLIQSGSIYTFSSANTKHLVSDSLADLITGNVYSHLYSESYGSSLDKQIWVGFDTSGNPTATCSDWTLGTFDASNLGQSSYTTYKCLDGSGFEDFFITTEATCTSTYPSGEWKLFITNNTQNNGCHQTDKHIICISQ